MDTEGLSIICAGLGSIDEDDDGNPIGYTTEQYCLDNLKDLLRFLRRDDPETRDVFKQVCKWNIVGKDLIPIIEFCQDDRTLVLNAVKVLVFLTMPVEPTSKDVNEQLDYLWGIKSAITFSDIIPVIVSLLEKPLENLECNAFSEEDWKLVQLVLTLFRNILAIQELPVQQKATGSANQLLSMRDNFIEKLFQESVTDIIIIVTQHVGGSCRYLQHDNWLLLEIYHYMFMGQDPELIAKTGQEDQKGVGDAKGSVESLKSIMQEEAEKRKVARSLASRHSQFSGTFTRLTLDGSKTMCKGSPNAMSHDKLLKSEKVERGPSKRVVRDYTRVPTTKRSILELFNDFLNQFLTGGYNVLTQSIAEDIEKEQYSMQNSDVLMFFQLAQFVTSFQYQKSILTKSTAESHRETSVSDDDPDDSTWFKGNICGPIAATMNESMFELVVAKWHFAFDSLKETKNNVFLSVTGSLVKIMIRMLDLVLKVMPENSKEPQTARSILYKLFYDQTDQGFTHFLFNMMRSFNAHKQPKSDLTDLVEIIHVVIRLMEKLQAHGTLRVSRKAKKIKKKKDDLRNTEHKTVGEDIIQNDTPCSGGNGSSNLSVSEKEKSTEMDCNGKEENIHVIAKVDEMETSSPKSQNPSGSLPHGNVGVSDQIHDTFITGADDGDSSADEQVVATNEVDLKLTSLLLSLATSSIISNLCWLLKFYKSNSVGTNHYILCLLRRICEDLDMTPMLYQLSCLVIFYDILNEQKACPRKEYENLVHFLTDLVRRMLRKMKTQPLLFLDVLFWKTRKDCQQINLECIQNDVGEMRKEVKSWGHARASAQESIAKSLADALGDDEYDVFIPNEPDLDKDMNINEATGEVLQTDHNEHDKIEAFPLKSNSEGVTKKKRRLVLNDKLEERIRSLYWMYKDDLNCSKLIAEALDPDGTISPAQVSRKCKKIGLQLPSKSTLYQAYISDAHEREEDGTKVDRNLQGSNNSDERSFLRMPMKRIRALDETQEVKIRSLFEQFKDHKRCSHMIAKQLDPSGEVTAAQVSRKLKKLGLHTSRMRTQINKPMMVGGIDASSDEDEDSDNLTLSLLKKKRSRSENAPASNNEQEVDVESPGHSSDDELLSSVLMKSKKARSKPEDKHTSSPAKKLADWGLEDEGLQGFGERNERGETEARYNDVDNPQPDISTTGFEYQAHETISPGMHSPLNQQKLETSDKLLESDGITNTIKENRSFKLADDTDEVPNTVEYNELEDSGDETMPSSSLKSSTNRRKLRMGMDFDDE